MGRKVRRMLVELINERRENLPGGVTAHDVSSGGMNTYDVLDLAQQLVGEGESRFMYILTEAAAPQTAPNPETDDS
jgi:hypothetical protein